MSEQAIERSTLVMDLITLTKPRLTSLVLITTAGGMALAPGTLSLQLALITLIGTGLVVGAAHAFNMYLERDIDALMSRTRLRPLPAGRLAPESAIILGCCLTLLGLPMLTLGVNPLTGALAAAALGSYVFVYTPLKLRSANALYVGAIPGAIPPMLGWAASTGSLEAPAFALFSILFLWQIPHFLGLALYLEDQYRAAGIQALPVASGIGTTRLHIGLSLASLAPVSLSPYFLLEGVGIPYAVSAVLLGVMLISVALIPIRAEQPPPPSSNQADTESAADPSQAPGPGALDAATWGRRLFLASLLYLTVLFVALVGDIILV